MNKRTEKKKITKIEPTIPETRSEIFYWGGTLVFFLIALIGVFHHEMWRDEIQAWLVARDSGSFAELFQNIKYEGTPILWHFFFLCFQD